MENTKSQEQKIAYQKKDLYVLYPKLSFLDMKNTINQVIAEFRGLELKKAKYKKSIRPVEFEMFKQRMGIR